MIVQKILYTIAAVLIMSNIPALYAAQLLFTPELFVTERYDDNIDLDYQNEKKDYITTAGLSLTGQILWRTAGIQLNYSPSYNAYADYKELESWRHAASLNAWKQAGRNTRFNLTNTYLRSNDPGDEVPAFESADPTQPPSIAADLNRRGRNEYYTNIAEARMTHNFGADDNVYLAYQYSILRDVDPLPGAIVDDNDTLTPSIGIAYNFSRMLGIQLDASYRNTDYVEQNDSHMYDGNFRFSQNYNRNFSTFLEYRHTMLNYEEDTDEDYKIYQPALGIRYQFQDGTFIEIAGAYRYQDFETSEDQEGSFLNSNINTKWEYRTGYFGISGGSGYEIDDYRSADNGLDLYYQARVEAGYSFTSRFSTTVYGTYRHDEYPNQTPDRVDHRSGAGLSFNWQALQWMNIGLSYNFTKVNSDDQTVEYTDNTAMLAIRLAPASPFHLN